MSAPTRGLNADQHPSFSLAFWNRVHRYRCLVQKFWWVLVLTLSLCLFAASFYQIRRPLTYLSTASLTLDTSAKKVSLGGDQGSNQVGPEDVMANEILVIKGRQVQQMATEALLAKYPDLLASPTNLNVTRDGVSLNLVATGTNADYAQRYLQAIVKAYFENRHTLRNQAGQESFLAMSNEIAKMQEALKADDDAINDYQRQTGVVFGREDSNGVNAALADARQKLDKLKDESTRLNLITSDQGVNRGATGSRQGSAGNGAGGQGSSGASEAGSGMEVAIQQANSQLVTLRSQRDDLAQDLRPKHPKMVALNRLITEQEQLIASYRASGVKQLEEQRVRVKALIETAQKDFTEAEKKALDVNQLRVRFDQLEENKARDLKHYDLLQTTLTQAMSNRTIEADPIHIMDPVSAAMPVPSSWVKTLGLALAAGLAFGVGILALIDRMDDRMGSINDFQLHFSEQVLGQIPRDPDAGEEDTDLLKADDPRHQLVESFRNLRSTLLYMPMEGERPKTLLVTSAVPNEGKSTVSTNLALVLAFAGMKTLLIDADLRRGAIHQKFDITRDPGLTDVLGHNVNWKIAIRQTKVENLHVLPRGRNVPQPSEYLLNKNTDRLLQELYPLYDFIIIDSSPVLAADDTASLAPKIDATLFVVRMSFTSAKMTRKSLEILYGRQANIPGLILNRVDTSSPEFVYYQYSEYYHTATDEDDGGASDKTQAGTKPTKPAVEV